ncbi:unnamed protein product [Brassica oleracea var. botrytis]
MAGSNNLGFIEFYQDAMPSFERRTASFHNQVVFTNKLFLQTSSFGCLSLFDSSSLTDVFLSSKMQILIMKLALRFHIQNIFFFFLFVDKLFINFGSIHYRFDLNRKIQISRECWREDELLSRYTDYFAKALSEVSFPCVKMFNESPNLSTLIDVPLSHIPQSIYGTTRNWMNLPPVEVLYFSVFILRAFDQILLVLEAQQGGGDDSKSQLEDKHYVHLVMGFSTGGELDLKPKNFLLLNEDENSPLKTIDFGLSNFYKPGDVFKDIVGDAYYIALEALQRKYESEAVI